MSGHTPGPWFISGKGTIRYGNGKADPKGGWIADAHWRNREANARLIAAAPELLEALTAMTARLSLYAGPNQVHAGEHDKALLAMANAAIAKATHTSQAA